MPSGLEVKDRTTTSLKFAWNAVPGAASYKIRLSRSKDMTNTLEQKSTDPSERFRGRAPGVKFYAQVKAKDANGHTMGGWSDTVSVSTRSL